MHITSLNPKTYRIVLINVVFTINLPQHFSVQTLLSRVPQALVEKESAIFDNPVKSF